MKVLLVGHVTEDIFGKETRIGGPPTYQTPIFLNLGYEVFVFTSAAHNFPFPTHPKLVIHNISSEVTTTFAFSENDDGTRKLKLVKRAKNLPENLPFKEKFDLAIISPICGEVSQPLLETIRNQANLCVGDIQGFIRTFSKEGFVSHKEEIDFEAFRNYFDILKGSNEEISQIPKAEGIVFILTKGPYPVQIIIQGKILEFEVEQVPNDQIIDSTGSGDLFLAGFSHAFLIDRNFETAVEFGNKMAIKNLFRSGPPGLKP